MNESTWAQQALDILNDESFQPMLDKMRALGISSFRAGEVSVTIDQFATMGAATRLRKDFEVKP